MRDDRTEIIELLQSTNRSGMENVIAWLDTDPSFYVASGARIHHDNVIGGLAAHSLRVYNLAKADWESCDEAFKTKYPLESIIISSSRPYCTMSARKTFILSMLMANRHGILRTTVKGMACAPFIC